MDKLGQALDKASYEWLAEESPELVEAIEEEVAQGTTSAQIKWFVLRHTQRPALASRCEQAARYLVQAQVNQVMATISISADATRTWQATAGGPQVGFNDDAEAG